MKIADLFVELGVSGEAKAVKALTGVKGSLDLIVDSGLAAKAALLAVMYAAEQVSAGILGEGAGIKNFGDATGISTKQLQQLQYEMMRVNGPTEEVASTLKGFQSIISAIDFNELPPKWLDMVMKMTGVTRQALQGPDGPVALFNAMRQFVNLGGDPGDQRYVANSLHVSDDLIAGMKRSGDHDWTKNQTKYSESQLKSFAKIQERVSDIKYSLEKDLGGFISAHGEKIVSGIDHLAHAFLHLAEALERVDEAYHVVDRLAGILDIIANHAGTTIAGASAGAVVAGPIGAFAGGALAAAGGGALDIRAKMVKREETENSFSNFLINHGAAGKQNSQEEMAALYGQWLSSTRHSPKEKSAPTVLHQNNQVHIHTDTDKPQAMAEHVSREIMAATKMGLGTVQLS